MADFELDADPTRWGRDAGGLPPRATEFLRAAVGEPTPKATPDWESLAVPAGRLAPEQVAGLAAIVGPDNLHTDGAARRRHAGGLSYLDLVARRADRLAPPDGVVVPGDSDEVARVLAFCEANGVDVITFGGGTSVVGGLRAGGLTWPAVALSTARLAELIDVDAESHLVTVGAGMTGPELEALLAPRGLTLGHYPQSWQRATIGGYAATRSAGQSSSGYGRSDDMVESMLVITPRGPLRVGRVAASAAGPDLRALMVGSEGAFGVITEVTLRVRRAPASLSDTGVVFADYAAGVTAFRQLVQAGEATDIMRLSDPEETATTLAMSAPGGRAGEALERYLRLRGVTAPSLAILGWEGDRASVAARRVGALGILRRNGGVSLGPTVGSAWRRHRFGGPFLRDHLMDAGYLVETLETATVWSRLPALRETLGAALRESLADGGPGPYVMSHISHVYDTGGSLYLTVIARAAEDPAAQWRAAKGAAMDAIVAAGATITHHHAVGRDHAPWLADEIGGLGVEVLRAVKGVLDPVGIMNPGVLGLSPGQ